MSGTILVVIILALLGGVLLGSIALAFRQRERGAPRALAGIQGQTTTAEVIADLIDVTRYHRHVRAVEEAEAKLAVACSPADRMDARHCAAVEASREFQGLQRDLQDVLEGPALPLALRDRTEALAARAERGYYLARAWAREFKREREVADRKPLALAAAGSRRRRLADETSSDCGW